MAEMWPVIIKNFSASDYLVEDLGIGITASGYVNFHEQFTYDEITGSDDLRTAVSGGSLVVSDGLSDFTTTAGTYYLTVENINHLKLNYYDKGELQTSGQSSVHWDNITNTPSGIAGNTLDGAYDEGGPGAGRTIDVDAGAVQLDATSGSYAPIELTEQSALPTTGLSGGQLSVKNGILYAYDSTRSKWISVQRMFLTFGRKGRTKNQYLDFLAGPSNNSGYRLARNATILSITGQIDATNSCDIRIRKNDVAANIVTLNISSALGNSDTTLNVDLTANEYLQSYLDASGSPVEDPMVIVEIAWRE